MLDRPALTLLIRRVRTEAHSQFWKKYRRALGILASRREPNSSHAEAICLAFSNFDLIARLAAPVLIRSGWYPLPLSIHFNGEHDGLISCSRRASVRLRHNGLISFGIATTGAVGALLVLGGRLAMIFSSPSAHAIPFSTKQEPAESLRATSQIAVSSPSAQAIPLFTKQEPAKSAPSSAVERKPKALTPMIRLSSVNEKLTDSADPMLKIQMPATLSAIGGKADRKKKPGGFRQTVGRIATKVFSVGRKKKVAVGLDESS